MIFIVAVPFLGTIFLIGMLWAAFRLNGLQLRIWRVSRRLRNCPEWEELQRLPPPGQGLSAEAGPAKQKAVLGRVLLILGILLFLGYLVLLAVAFLGNGDSPPPVLLPMAAVLFIYIGAQQLAGTRAVVCPHCGLTVKQTAGTVCFICPKCGKSSLRQGEFFTSEEYLRSLPQFQDLPKL